MGDDSEWIKLPTEEKCQNKVWKARLAGYEEATKLFKTLSEKSPDYSRYAGLLKKFVTDSNAVAQEKGLDAVFAFVKDAPTNICARTCNEVVSGIVTKCMNASKQKSKEKGIEIIMLYIEAEKADVVQECLLAGMENKQPKVVIGCVQTVTAALRDFGTKIIQVKPLLKLLPKLLDDRDKNVREETKQLVIEIYRWIGAAIKPQMTNFKAIQVQEFEAEFEKLPSQKPQQQRFLRSQQDLKVKMEEQVASGSVDSGGCGDGAAEEEAVDPYDLMTPVDVLSQLPKNFFEQIEAKKWQERKEMLEAVQKLAENARIENGEFGPLVRALSKVIAKDSNVMLVTLAVKVLASLANGLRKKFQPYGVSCVGTILEKFKEKKVTVVAALREAIDACFYSINLEAIMEDIVAALDNKNPSIKGETALFLARCFARCTQSSLPKKILKIYIVPLLKTANDTMPEVREASFHALGTAMKVVTERNVAAFLVDVDSIKMQKIQDCCQKAVLLNAKGEPRAGGGAVQPEKKQGSAPPATAGSTAPKPVKKPATKPGGDSKTKPAKKPAGKAKKGPVEEKLEPALSDEVVEEKAQEFLPGDTLASLISSNWKERLAAMETFVKAVSSTSSDDIPCQVCVRTLSKKPGFKDTNFQVLKLKLELLAHLTRNSKFSKRSAEFCIQDVVEKVGDVKTGVAAKDALTGMAEAIGLDFISVEVLSRAFEQKNPKTQQESITWLSQAIRDFGLKIRMKDILAAINKALAATNPTVRSAAISLLGVLYMYMGENLRVFFDSEKPALLQQIDAEFAKMKDVSPPVPTKKLLSSKGNAEEEEEDEDEDKDADENGETNTPVQDLLPRTDIIEKMTDALIEEMRDKNWKVRGEGLQKMTTILSEAKFVTHNLGPLPEALKARLNDPNKILQMTTIAICQTLAAALGQHSKSHFKVIGPGLITCLGDSKPALREKVVACLNVWVDNATLLPLVESEALYDGLKIENPFLRAELLKWLSERLPSHKQLPIEIRGCLPLILTCLEDRNPEVRKKAQESVLPFMIHTGYDAFLKALGKSKASKDQIQPLLEKARGELPAKPTKAKKVANPPAEAPVRQKAAPKAAAPARMDDSDEFDGEPVAPPAKSESKSKVVKGKGKPAPAASKKKEEEDFGPAMSIMVTKEHRIKEEKAMKVLKWNFLELRAEYVEQLRNQMEKNFNKAVMVDLFHHDFKFHIKAIEQLLKCLETQEKETLANIDLVLKWLTIRFFDTNPSMLNKALDYLQRLFNHLSSIDYHLTDLEASSFIPYLIMKSGEPKDNVRRDVRAILRLLCKVYPSSKLFSFVIDGLKCKLSKQRTELLEELGCLIEIYGMNVCQPSPAHALKIIAGEISNRDNSVRNAALNTIVVAHSILGENVYKFIGTLKEKDQSLLEERIKRSMKNAKPVVKEPLQPQQPPQQQMRPKTAPAGGLTKAVSQPNVSSRSAVKKTYQLDIEPEEKLEMITPNLIEMDMDMDDVLAPVAKPKIKARPSSPNPASKLIGMAGVSASIGSVVSQIAAVDIETSIRALAQIDEVVKDEKRAEVMTSHVDNILVVFTMQFKMGISKYLLDPSVSNNDVIQLYRCLLGTLINIFDKSGLGKKASTHMLKDLIQSLLTVILDNQIEQLEEGPQIVRSVNIVVVRIINKSDPTSITCAVISLMRDCLQSETSSSSFLELVTKCLWKVLKLVPDTINELSCDRILYECHLFFQAFPSSSWKSRRNLDMPIRTIKTLLHNLTKLKGQKILSHTALIGASENSEVEAYLHTVLAKVNFKPDDESDKPKNSPSGKRVSKTHELLSEIFTKIGTKENTREGLNDLYDFKRKYPEADVEPFLKKTSPHFQKYINNMLSEIDEERRGKKTSEFESNREEEVLDVEVFREKLRVLRAGLGLDSNSAQGDSNKGSNVRTLITSEDTQPADLDVELTIRQPHQAEPAPAQSVDMTSLKARLERIKKMANS